KRTRTSTELPPLAPEASASTNSATWAGAGRAFSGVRRGLSTSLLQCVDFPRRTSRVRVYHAPMRKKTSKTATPGPAKAAPDTASTGAKTGAKKTAAKKSAGGKKL